MATMNAFELGSRVEHTGKNFWGRESQIVIAPKKTGYGFNWYWSDSGTEAVSACIEPSIANVTKRQVSLADIYGCTLPVWEHIGVLRFFNLIAHEGILLSCRGWTPYDGRAISLWSAIKPKCEFKPAVEVPLYTVMEKVQWEYPDLRGGLKAYTEICPSTDGILTLEITRAFKGVGVLTKTFKFPDNVLLEKVCNARTLGWPRLAYHASRLASVCGWPHHGSVVWPQECDPERLLEENVEHTALDILGSLSLLCGNGYFVGRVRSVCSGHLADIAAVKLADKKLVHCG